MGLTPRGTLPSMRPTFEPAATSLDARKLSLVQTWQRVEHVVVNSRHVTSLLICANSKQTGSSRNRSHDDVYRDHDRSCRSTAAAAMINYEANAPLAAFAPQNDAAAVSAQNPVAGCDTNEAPIFQGQWPLHY